MYTENKKPLISICVPCYNHAKYIPTFMESILSQDYDNWELIITDDCSTDDSLKILKSFNDKRIKIYQNDRNRHLCDTMNNSFSHASGKYICIMYTDDAMCPGKLKHDVEFMEKHPGIAMLYTDAIWIDDDNNVIPDSYKIPRTSREDLLNKMFLSSNVISVPGMFIRKKCFDEIGGHNRLLRLTQDYEHHIRFLFNYDFAISDTPTVMYRIRADGKNLSRPNTENINAQRIELTFALQQYIKYIKTPEQLLKIFPDAKKYGVPQEWSIPYFLGRIALESDINSVKYFGLNLIYTFMQQGENIEKLEKYYNFLPVDFMNLVKKDYIFVSEPPKCKHKKYKKLFNLMLVLNVFLILLIVFLQF